MMNIKKKIIASCVMLCCAFGTVAAAAYMGGGTENAIPVSVFPESELPVIILDAGHGGFDGGCTDANGVPEKGINLDILLKLRDMLKAAGYDVKVTREEDISIHDVGVEGIANQKSSDMDNRLALFNSEKNAVCVSIHQNQFTDPIYHGAQMFYSASDKRSEKLARSVQDRFREFLQPDNDREIKLCGKELFLCYYSENPTIMAECGFMSNPEEAAMLNDDEYRSKVAFTLFAGINDFVSELFM